MYILAYFKSNLGRYAKINAVIVKNQLCQMLGFKVCLSQITRQHDVRRLRIEKYKFNY